MNYSVKPVQTGADWKAFHEVPHVTQGHDPFWIAPLNCHRRWYRSPGFRIHNLVSFFKPVGGVTFPDIVKPLGLSA